MGRWWERGRARGTLWYYGCYDVVSRGTVPWLRREAEATQGKQAKTPGNASMTRDRRDTRRCATESRAPLTQLDREQTCVQGKTA